MCVRKYFVEVFFILRAKKGEVGELSNGEIRKYPVFRVKEIIEKTPDTLLLSCVKSV